MEVRGSDASFPQFFGRALCVVSAYLRLAGHKLQVTNLGRPLKFFRFNGEP